MSSRLALFLAAAAALPCACIGVTPPGVTLATTPPGAKVYVNGRDSGFVTPARIALEGEDRQWIQFQLDGYATTDLFLFENKRVHLVTWQQGDLWVQSLPYSFPLFLGIGDLLFPIRVDRSPSPSRVHVQMRLAAEE